MKFLESGADIPDELIRAVNEESATFLCGAGVSFRVGLPTFKKLTEGIYTQLGETWTSEPAERNAIDKGQYDRALRALEKRTHFPKTGSSSNTRKFLKQPSVKPTAAHGGKFCLRCLRPKLRSSDSEFILAFEVVEECALGDTSCCAKFFHSCC